MERTYVLIVDDVAVNRKILGKILADDYDVLEAENGADALDKLKKNRNVSAVMLDLMMPVMDGFTFLKLKGENEKYTNIPVIVTTGDNDEINEINALKCGAWDFVVKPYKPEIIKLRLASVIAKSQLTAFDQLKYLAEYDPLTGI